MMLSGLRNEVLIAYTLTEWRGRSGVRGMRGERLVTRMRFSITSKSKIDHEGPWTGVRRLGAGMPDEGRELPRLTAALGSRLVFYATRDYASQLARGAGYEDLTPTAVIAWLVEPMFPDLHRLHACFELRDRYTHTLFGDELTLHVLQLSMLAPSPRPGEDVRVHRWARFFMAQSDEELEQLAAEDPTMSLAKETLEALSQDPTICRLAREREDALALYRIDLATNKRLGKAEGLHEGKEEGLREGKAAGLREGLREGKAALLLKQLALRFGPPSENTRAIVSTASPEQLDTWAERILTVATLDEVLAP